MANIEACWVLLPVLGAYLLLAPVHRYDLFPALKLPIDAGVRLRGRPLFGPNKTWRGAVTMVIGTLAGSLALSFVPSYWRRLPAPVQSAGPVIFGLLLGLGFALGELPNSLLKRQLDIAPGGRGRSFLGVAFTLFDQGDFILGVWLFLAPIWPMTPLQALCCFALAVVVHPCISLIGLALMARKTAI
jgi:hypothetical protein